MTAISLLAHQKNLTELYSGSEDIFVIPAYQRPYSWTTDKCYQLYIDISNAFIADMDYFVGNLVMARGNDKKNEPEIVDGQQRLITLWLFLKVLTLLHPSMSRLRRTLEVESLLRSDVQTRIRSEVFENDDQKLIHMLLKADKSFFDLRLKEVSSNKGEILENKCDGRIEINILNLYKWLCEFYGNIGLLQQELFLQYFLNRVSLLPIELQGNSMVEASASALTIFETINNRGQSLEDADIFKAELYNKAKKVGEEKLFINQWVDLKTICDELGFMIDDIFRFYYHILRGQESITSNETNLRDFFTNNSLSPLGYASYKAVMDDLNKIVEVLQYLNKIDSEKNELTIWLQILQSYTNLYPKYALVNYIFVNGYDKTEELKIFLQSIIRYYYYKGSTTQVKYETYNINKLVAHHKPISEYLYEDVTGSNFDYLGQLKYGFSLLAYYLRYPECLKFYYIDRIINSRDFENLPINWINAEYDDLKNSIANFIVLDITKRNIPLDKKHLYYKSSLLPEPKTIFDSNGEISHESFFQRERILKNVLVNFFNSGENGSTNN